jgi:hypothetical protein
MGQVRVSAITNGPYVELSPNLLLHCTVKRIILACNLIYVQQRSDIDLK